MSKYVATGLLSMTLLGSLAGCGGAAESDTDAASSESGYDETITIDVYNGLANYMGMQEGWFAKIVRDKFNMELNIIAPNVAGNGDTLLSNENSSRRFG